MKNILRTRPRTVANRPTSGGWGNKKCFFRLYSNLLNVICNEQFELNTTFNVVVKSLSHWYGQLVGQQP